MSCPRQAGERSQRQRRRIDAFDRSAPCLSRPNGQRRGQRPGADELTNRERFRIRLPNDSGCELAETERWTP